MHGKYTYDDINKNFGIKMAEDESVFLYHAFLGARRTVVSADEDTKDKFTD